MTDRLGDWMIRKTRENPGRTVVLGFVPAFIFVFVPMVRDMVDAMRDQPWMALIYVPLLTMMVLLGWCVWLLARLSNRLKDRE